MEEDVSLDKILQDKNINMDKAEFDKNDVVVIPNERLTDDDVYLIKELRISEKKSVHVHDQEKTKFKDYRGAEYDLALYVINTFLIPVFTGVVTTLITNKITDWRKKKSGNSAVKEPDFKVEFYVKDKAKKWTFKGKADDVIKALKDLQGKNND